MTALVRYSPTGRVARRPQLTWVNLISGVVKDVCTGIINVSVTCENESCPILW